MQEVKDQMTEELADCKNKTERDQLLQKYGLIEPKLTLEEKYLLIVLEAHNEPTYRV
jgi:hypothetical protein